MADSVRLEILGAREGSYTPQAEGVIQRLGFSRALPMESARIMIAILGHPSDYGPATKTWIDDLSRRIASRLATGAITHILVEQQLQDNVNRLRGDLPNNSTEAFLFSLSALKQMAVTSWSVFSADQDLTSRLRDVLAGPSQSVAAASGYSQLARIALEHANDDPIRTAAADSLGFGRYAGAIAELICSEDSKPPLTLAVSGRWGAGKSSLVGLIAQQVRTRRREGVVFGDQVVEFDAWQHSDAAHIDSALLSNVARALYDVRFPLFGLPFGLLNRAERAIRLATYATLTFLVFVLTWLLVPAGIQGTLRNFLSIGVGAATVIGLTAANIATTAGKVGSLVWSPEQAARRGNLRRVRDQWHSWVDRQLRPGTRLVVIVENLDRCNAEQIGKLVEFIGQVLSGPRLVVVIAADLQVLAQQLGGRMPGRESAANHERKGYDYLQKVVHVQFDVPPVARQNVADFLSKLATPPPPTPGGWKIRVDRLVLPWKRIAWVQGTGFRNPYAAAVRLRNLGNLILWDFLRAGNFLMSGMRTLLVPKTIKSKFSSGGIPLDSLFRMFGAAVIATIWTYAIYVLGTTLPSPIALTLELLPWIFLSYGAYSLLVLMAMGVVAGLTVRLGLAVDTIHPQEKVEAMRREIGAVRTPTLPGRPEVEHEQIFLTRALATALEGIQGHPRFLKRVVVRLRLEVYVWLANPPVPTYITAELVGKWVAFMVRWPHHYQEVMAIPQRIQALETQTAEDDTELAAFLRRGPPLSPHIEQLATYTA